ncbi:sensor histidine kinase [Thermocoleostomius sinensis]|uniref:histidine kinase n=1 Tax=Thermocoleostomius sinensis A174 TaxID=2016057 RepID=A0A9E9CBK1_9CYAN|nr:HAMP domain-containing sensor histidine kinase [Thermocoleostomius sinensis]WAL60695.1 HAMP domain-containing sensor histidine kinase [Thermocoleostomius sinensis A174]
MFQATRRRLALWYTTVTAILLLLFASGFYLYVRHTLVERIDDTLNHVAEVVQRSLIVEAVDSYPIDAANGGDRGRFQVNIEASFPSPAEAVEDDHIDLEWFSPSGELLWSTFSAPLNIPLHPNDGETVYGRFSETDPTASTSAATSETSFKRYPSSFALRQITHRVKIGPQDLGYLRVSHPWFEVTTPSRQLIRDLSVGTTLTIVAVAAIGWFLSGLAIAPVRDSYQRLKQFTADASHELRNPIAVIQTNVQVALADPDPHLQQDQLRVVERLTRRLGRLVDDLLFLARQDSGMTPLKLDAVDLEELIQEVIEEQQSVATDKSLTLVLKPPESISTKTVFNKTIEAHQSYTVQGDRDQLTRLFTNLISNAVQYTPAAGQIEVSLQRVKQSGHTQIQIQVKDTGIGIPMESLPHIFDRFYRVDPARTTLPTHSTKPPTSTGSGLGLAIAKVIVDNHQGQISVTSVPEQGTTFCVWLPLLTTET